ncbi:MAG: acetyl-CoA carboxylase carboxyl transferase subunit beta [Spirochaetaceae bacterium]|jgi:acetyl-CoA carboxylase carboxyl transferase subunit beta|nr:acetyl-CoA carboxylase carboxyl transferase subunit beta [Spirochaetaceae bacterium]
MQEEKNEPCPSCGGIYSVSEIAEALKTCPGCGHHYRMEPQERIRYLTDPGSFAEFSENLTSLNPIDFIGYKEKLSEAETKVQMKDAVITGTCAVEGRKLILGLMSFNFMGGSMGSVVGEKVSRALLMGAETGLPVALYTTSGGARMQEGIFSLLQMAKTSSAAAELDKAGVPFFVVLCDPTTGGVTASFAMLADVTLAEPGARIGFAGPRVIEGTIRESLPEGFQRAEFQQDKGFVDLVVPRNRQRSILKTLIDLHTPFPKEEEKLEKNEKGIV